MIFCVSGRVDIIQKIKSLTGWSVTRFNNHEFDLLHYIFPAYLKRENQLFLKIQFCPSSQERVIYISTVVCFLCVYVLACACACQKTDRISFTVHGVTY